MTALSPLVLYSGQLARLQSGDSLASTIVSADTTNFNRILSASDNTAQKALDTIDNTVQASLANTGSVNQVLHGNPSGEPSFSTVTEADITLSNNTTNNATTVKHGFMPLLSNVATQFLNGQGNFATPAGTASAYVSQSFTSQTTVTVTHNFGAYPVVQVIDGSGLVLIPLTINNTSINAFTVTFDVSTSGVIMATLGSPQLNTYISVSNNYTTLAGDYIVECTATGKTVTLITASGRAGKIYVIKNSSSGDLIVACTGGETIDGIATGTLVTKESVTVYSNGTNWGII